MTSSFRIESLMSARLFMNPQLAGNRLYFISNLSGRMSLYAMDKGGSIPEPLLPGDIALQNPTLMEGESFFVFPRLGKVMVLIDKDGDENYQPMFVPLEGGLPEPVFGDRFKGMQVRISHADAERNLAALQVDPRNSPMNQSYLAHLETRQLTDLGSSLYLNVFAGHNDNYTKIALIDAYMSGDQTLYLWELETGKRRLLYGVPLEERIPGQEVPLNSIFYCHFTPGDKGLLFYTSLFDWHYGLGYMRLDAPDQVKPVQIVGTTHRGSGELSSLKHLRDQRYLLEYNIDGASYVYEGTFDEEALCFQAQEMIVGEGKLGNGVLQHLSYEKESDSFAFGFSTATSPAQVYTFQDQLQQHTRERILGVPEARLSPGEDASYTSHDGLRISARLYLPSPDSGYQGRRPVIFYIHGGPQSQERPDFTWFSMPLIQFFTLNGFAVFVPNVRGSSGYGLDYMKRVDRDWGGLDRLDHVAAFELLRKDERLDMDRVGVMGRSYGGYMTLTLAGRHPELWKAAVDMFGPYNLITFIERLPETWQTYFRMSVGDPVKDRDFVLERSPSTHLHQLQCPLFVIQGHNDPRVVERESRDLVEQLRAQGKNIEFLVFQNEGHDVLKFENKVHCYNEITNFFKKYLEA